MPGDHGYYDSLVARPDLVAAYDLRSQASIELGQLAGTGIPTNEPIVYDSAVDAAKVTILAGGSNSSTQRRFDISGPTAGDVFLTWDFIFPAEWRWQFDEKLKRHKTWQVGGDPGFGGNRLFVIKTDYKLAAGNGGPNAVAEMWLGYEEKAMGNYGPGTFGAPTFPGERPAPFDEVERYQVQADTLTRAFLLFEGIEKQGLGGDNDWMQLSLWFADEHRPAQRVYNRIKVAIPDANDSKGGQMNGFDKFWLEWNTSDDQLPATRTRRAYQRNLVVLHNPGDVTPLLVQP